MVTSTFIHGLVVSAREWRTLLSRTDVPGSMLLCITSVLLRLRTTERFLRLPCDGSLGILGAVEAGWKRKMRVGMLQAALYGVAFRHVVKLPVRQRKGRSALRETDNDCDQPILRTVRTCH